MEQKTFEKTYSDFISAMETEYAPNVLDEAYGMTDIQYSEIIEKCATDYKNQKTNSFQRPYTIFAFNIKKMQIDFSFGLTDFLGIKDIEPGKADRNMIKTLCKTYHPDYADAFLRHSHSVYMGMLTYGSEILRSPHSFTTGVVVPIKCKDGQFYWFEFRTQILQYDKNGHIISHLVRCEQIKPYVNGIDNIIEINLYIDGFIGMLFHKIVAKTVKKKLTNYFSTTEWNLIKDYAGLENGIKEQHTKDYLNKLRFKIVHKATAFFGYKFQRVELLATYLKEKDFLKFKLGSILTLKTCSVLSNFVTVSNFLHYHTFLIHLIIMMRCTIKSNFLRCVAFFFSFLCLSPEIFAKNYFIRTDGNDSNTGLANTPSAAWKTVNSALYGYCNWGAGPTGQGVPMLPGDTLFVNDGVYVENGFGQGLKIDGIAGSNTKRFVLKSINKWGAKLELSSQYNNFNILNSKGVTIDGFDIYNAPGSTNIYMGINVSYPSEFVTIRNCKVHNFGLGGIGGDGDNIIVENNEVYDNAIRNPGNGSGINFYESKKVSSNTLTGGYGHIIRGNRVYNNYCQQYYTSVSGVYGPPTDGNGIIIDDWNSTQNTSGTPYKTPCLIENNVCFKNGGSGIRVYDSDNVLIRNNTCYYNCWVTANYPSGSTAYPSGDIGVSCESGKGNNIVTVNNICISDPSLPASNHGIGIGTNNTNCRASNNYTNKLFFASGGTANIIGVSPQFVNASVNPSVANFRLTSLSPAINIGLNSNAASTDFDGVVRPQGGVVDAGSYEFVVTCTPPSAGILTAVASLCVGSTTNCTSSVTGGVWSISPISVATISATGVITGIGAGTATITYTVSANGCSSAVTKSIVVNAAVSAPTFSVPSGTLTVSQAITIATPTSGATIRYTLDNTTPSSTTGTVYSVPVTVSTTQTIKAIAYNATCSSSVNSATYTFFTPVVVRARSLNAAGANIRVDIMSSSLDTGTTVVESQTFNNLSMAFADYTFNAISNVKPELVRVNFINDGGSPNYDLEVDYMKVGSTTYQTEAATTYSIGAWRNNNCSNGAYDQSVVLQCNGYFHFMATNVLALKAAKAQSNTTNSGLRVYPNPVQNILNVDFFVSDENNAQLNIVDITGREVWHNTQILSVGQSQLQIPIDLAQGIYFINLKGSNYCETQKLIVE